MSCCLPSKTQPKKSPPPPAPSVIYALINTLRGHCPARNPSSRPLQHPSLDMFPEARNSSGRSGHAVSCCHRGQTLLDAPPPPPYWWCSVSQCNGVTLRPCLTRSVLKFALCLTRFRIKTLRRLIQAWNTELIFSYWMCVYHPDGPAGWREVKWLH